MFNIYFSPQALKAIRKANPEMRKRVHELAGILQTEPVPAKRYDVTKLSGGDGYFRIRLSRYRLQYFVDWKRKKIQVLNFGLRDEHTYD
ncbi:type II toxin-antitoxin system RelE/ParE family toxin [Candidatus Micrarchaeota archaeon]|nr:type II toxin-antitoxin system RelE/ParE family toxin [Candidatus Micrarchaeota archaeon]